MNHYQKPEISNDLDKELEKIRDDLLTSDYCTYIKLLSPKVKDQTVKSSFAGNSGFILFLENGCWVASFLHENKLIYETGNGKPEDSTYRKINSSLYGDGSSPLTVDLPYADEENEISKELEQSYGKTITGLAIGSDCFSFCFPKGMELESLLMPNKAGCLALRVFWEQW